MYSSFLQFILQRHIVNLDQGVLFILSTLFEERHHLWEQHWTLLHNLKWLKFYELPRILSRPLDSYFSYFKSVAVYWMRKQIFWPIGIKTRAYWIPHSIIFGLLRNQNFSHQFKKFYWGIPLPNHLTRLQPDSWKGLLIYLYIKIEPTCILWTTYHWFSKGFCSWSSLKESCVEVQSKVKLLWMK